MAWLRRRGYDLEKHRRANGKWIPGLFHIWLRQQYARAMGAVDDWNAVIMDALPAVAAAKPSESADQIPRKFTLDNDIFQLDEALVGDHYKLARGEAPMHNAWWRFIWGATCREV